MNLLYKPGWFFVNFARLSKMLSPKTLPREQFASPVFMWHGKQSPSTDIANMRLANGHIDFARFSTIVESMLQLRIMKRVLYISILAIIMVCCLQGYNIYLQYSKYVEEQISEINIELVKSIDEERSLRSLHKEKQTKGEQKLQFQVFDQKSAPKPPKGDQVFDLKSFNIKN